MIYTFSKTKNVDEGNYECTLEKFENKTWEDKTYWQLTFRIRSDVDKNPQKWRNWTFRKNIYYGAYYDDKSAQVLQELMNAKGYDGNTIEIKDIKDNEGKVIKSAEEQLREELLGLYCVVNAKNITTTEGKNLQVLHFRKSAYQPIVLDQNILDDAPLANAPLEDLDDLDAPFNNM